MKQSKWTKILVAAGCCALATGAGVMNLTSTAKAENIMFQGVDVTSFAVNEQAELRLVPGSTTETGIRFIASMDSVAYTALEAKETAGAAVNYGMLIVPKDYLTSKGAVTEENVFGANAIYCLEEKTHDENCTKTHIASVKSDIMTDDGATAVFRGSLVDIIVGNVHREFVGIAYVEYLAEGVTDYELATADNARSMTYLAQKAIQDNNDDDSKTLYNTYVKPLEGAELKYMVEHYIPNEDGAYELAETEEKWGAINEEVSASNIAKVDSAYGEYATYKLNAKDTPSNVSDIVYVNGKTVLKCYYEEVNTTLFSAAAGADSDEVKLMQATNTDAGKWGRLTDKSSAELVTDTVDGVEKQVLKLTSVDNNKDRDTVLDLQLLESRLQDAADANWDYITIKMKITAEFVAGCAGFDLSQLTEEQLTAYNTAQQKYIDGVKTVVLSNGNVGIGSYAVGEWVDVVIPKAKLNTAYTKNSAGTAWTYASEYVGSKDNLDKDNPAKTNSVFNSLFSKHGTGSSVVADNFLTTFTYQNKVAYYYPTASGGTSYVLDNKVTLRPHDVAITCYVDTITWGVDYTAPTIENVETEAYFDSVDATTVTYIPGYEVKDDILPQANGNHVCLIESEANVYEIVDGTYVLQEAGENGAYTLERGKNYKLRISAWDWSVSDMDGNKRTEEYDLIVENMYVIDFSNEKDMANVSTMRNTIHEETFLESYTGVRDTSDTATRTGVMRLDTSMSGANRDGASFVLNFAPGRVDRIMTEYYAALADDTVDFELNITMLFEFGTVGTYGEKLTLTQSDGTSGYAKVICDEYGKWDSSTATFYDGTGVTFHVGGKAQLSGVTLQAITDRPTVVAADESTKMREGVWYTLTFTEELLRDYCGWTNDATGKATALAELSGEAEFFWFSGNLCVFGGASAGPYRATPVTYFVDEISYGTKTK